MGPLTIGFLSPSSCRVGDVVHFCSFAASFSSDGNNAIGVLFDNAHFPFLSDSIQVISVEEVRKSMELMKSPTNPGSPLDLSGLQNKRPLIAFMATPSSFSEFSSVVFKESDRVVVVHLNEFILDAEGIKSWILNEAALLLLGVFPSIEEIRRVKSLLGRFLIMGVPREKLWVYSVGRGFPGGISSELIRTELGDLSAEWPYDPGLVLRAENSGMLIQDVRPRSALSLSISELAKKAKKFLEASSVENKKKSSRDVLANALALEKRIISGVWRRYESQSNGTVSSMAELSAQIDREIESVLMEKTDEFIHSGKVEHIRKRVKDHVMGLGPLQPMLSDPSINEIMVNGTDIFIEREGRIENSPRGFENENQLRAVIERMVSRSGRRVDWAAPMCDVRLPDGSRVNVILPPLSLEGPIVTIRRFRPRFQTMRDLISEKTLTEGAAAALREAVQKRKNILISGNTGAGKTTLLNVLSGFIPSGERIITLEDAAELRLRQDHVVRLETRPKNAEGAGEISMSDLLVNALRMRPDRIIIGECRGSETVPMLQALNTGHDGSMTTLHANSAADALRRLESLVLLTAPQWPVSVIREQIAAGINLILHIKRVSGERKLTEITRLKFQNGHIVLEDVFGGGQH